MRANLTDKVIKAKSLTEKREDGRKVTHTLPPASGTFEIWDTVQPGLALRVHAGGKRTYCCTTRLAPDGQQIRRTIGTTASHKISEARKEAQRIVEAASRGEDIASREAKQEAARLAKIEAERSKKNSFRSIVEGYLADPGRHGGAKMKSHKLVEQRLENHCMKQWGDRPIAGIHRSEVKELLRDMVRVGKPIAANRLLGNLKLVWKWAVEQDKLEASPIADMDKLVEEQSRDRVLTQEELRAVWKGCDSLSKAHCGAIRLMILTGARRTEAGGLLRSEIVDGDWHLPAERSKNKLPHIWPLSESALAVIASVPQVEDGDPVFTLDGKRSVNGWSKTKAKLDAAIAKARAKAAGAKKPDPKKHALPRWTLHDLRRTLVTDMNEKLAVPPHVVEAAVNHVSGAKAGVAGVYNRASYMPQRREALGKWASYMAAVVAGRSTKGIVYVEPATNVVPLKQESAA